MIGLRRTATSGMLMLAVAVGVGGCSPSVNLSSTTGPDNAVVAAAPTSAAAGPLTPSATEAAFSDARRSLVIPTATPRPSPASSASAAPRAATKDAEQSAPATTPAPAAPHRAAPTQATPQHVATEAAPKPAPKPAAKVTAPKKATPKPPARKPATPTAQTMPQLAALTNAQRRSNGRAALTISSCAQRYAVLRAQAEAAAKSMVHTPTSGLRRALSQCHASWVGENIAMGFSSDAAVMSAWMASPEHRANILSTHATAIGVAMARAADGTPYYAQFFLGHN